MNRQYLKEERRTDKSQPRERLFSLPAIYRYQQLKENPLCPSFDHHFQSGHRQRLYSYQTRKLKIIRQIKIEEDLSELLQPNR